MRKFLFTIFLWGLIVMEAEGEAQGQGHLMLTDSLKMVKPATYGIAIQRSKPEGVETTYVGTGFFVSGKYLVTAAHVIKNSTRPLQPQDIILMYQPEPPGASFKLIGPLTIAHLSEEVDLAILQSPLSSPASVQLDFGAVRDGESVAIYGISAVAAIKGKIQAFRRVASGVISVQTRTGKMEVIESTIIGHQGYSGSPLFVARSGKVIAVHKGTSRVGDSGEPLVGYSMATSIRGIKSELENLGVLK